MCQQIKSLQKHSLKVLRVSHLLFNSSALFSLFQYQAKDLRQKGPLSPILQETEYPLYIEFSARERKSQRSLLPSCFQEQDEIWWSRPGGWNFIPRHLLCLLHHLLYKSCESREFRSFSLLPAPLNRVINFSGRRSICTLYKCMKIERQSILALLRTLIFLCHLVKIYSASNNKTQFCLDHSLPS